MNKILKNIILGFCAVLVWLGLYEAYQYTNRATLVKKSELAALLNSSQTSLEILPPTKFSNCQINGSLPDPDCTPGAIFKDANTETICVSGYTKTVRKVSLSTRKKVFADYQIPYPPATGSYELDHLIPLALGGNNDSANLFPEAVDPFPGFKEKDVAEVYLQQEVCSGHITLTSAQYQIAKNWVLIYNNLSPESINAIKSRYKSWAN